MKKKASSYLQNPSIPKQQKHKHCGFCKSGSDYVNYKDPDFLLIFLNPQGRILPPAYTGNCRKHQKMVASTIKRARHLAFIPYERDNIK